MLMEQIANGMAFMLVAHYFKMLMLTLSNVSVAVLQYWS
jgi:hypothetical protein